MLAMAAVEANLATINQDQLMARAPEIEARIRAGIGPLVSAIRGRGCLLGIVLDRPAAPVIKALRERGVLSGGAGDPHVIRIMPALTTRDEEIDVFVQAFEEAIANA
jgi:acetylornithine aminotransferase/acetylornithine/N-succinyldiaminopimelate aminotransferase